MKIRKIETFKANKKRQWLALRLTAGEVVHLELAHRLIALGRNGSELAHRLTAGELALDTLFFYRLV